MCHNLGANILTLFPRCLLSVLIRLCDVIQRQIKVEKTVCFNGGIYNVAQPRINAVYFNADMNNVVTKLSFSTSSFTTLVNVETTL